MGSQTKLWIIGGAVGLIVLILILFLLSRLTSGSSNSSAPLSFGPSSSTESQIENLQQEVNTLMKEVNVISTQSASTTTSAPTINPNSSLADQVSSLESNINLLNTKVTNLEQGSTTNPLPSSSPTTSGSSSLYIPLGSTDPNNSESWQSIDSMAETLNPSSFPGYSTMQLEVAVRLNAGSGTGNVRLINSTTQTVIATSAVSTSSTSYSVLVSSPFSLPAGNNLYTVQVMSSLGDTIFIQNARIKVNF